MAMNTALARRPQLMRSAPSPFMRRSGPSSFTRVGGFWPKSFKSAGGVSREKPPMSNAEKRKRVGTALGRAVGISGVAYLAGYGQGRYGAQKVPWDLMAGTVSTLTGVFMTGGKLDSAVPILQVIGDATLAAHFAAAGRGRGKAARARAGGTPLIEGEVWPGRPELQGTASLSDEELARVARTVAG